MSYEVRQQSAFTILGIWDRASNSCPERIGTLWRRFHRMGSAQCIDGRLDDTVYCVYCEYQGDYTGEYTVVIGCAVPTDTPVPEEMRTIRIAAGRFAVISVTGPLPQGVFEAWSEIWKSPLDRTYQADFDRYGADSSVAVHVGIR